MANNQTKKVVLGKNAFVLGGSSGIGAAIALKLAQEGANVAITWGTNEKKSNDVLTKLRQINPAGQFASWQVDISKVSEVKRIFELYSNHFNTLDILVHSPAVALLNPLTKVTEEEYDRTFNTNAKSTFFSLQEAASRITEGGRIIVVSTGATKMTSQLENFPAYIGSKLAVEAFVRSFAHEIANKKVTVNTVNPGYTKTDMLPQVLEELGSQASPFKKLGEPEEIADATVFLASDDARWITGQALHVNGGVVMV